MYSLLLSKQKFIQDLATLIKCSPSEIMEVEIKGNKYFVQTIQNERAKDFYIENGRITGTL